MPDTLQVTMKGNPVNLIGSLPEIGQSIPEATLAGNDLSDVTLSSFKGKKLIISVVPSLDTGICDLQTKRFNAEAKNLGDDVAVLTVSVDLPFAQKRWCGATGSDHVITASDYKTRTFGKDYGLLIDGLYLLARAIFVVDADGVLKYSQVVPEITTEPNYDEVLEAVKNL